VWRLRPEAQERERRLAEDGRRKRQGRLDDDGGRDIWEHVVAHDPAEPCADRTRTLDVRLLDDGQGRRPHDPGEDGRVDDADGHHGGRQAGAEDARDGDDQDDAGEREHHIDEASGQGVYDAETVAGDETQRPAQGEGDPHRHDAHLERDARAVDDPAKHVSAELVGAEEVTAARREKAFGRLRRRVERGDERGGQGEREECADQDDPHQGRRASADLAPDPAQAAERAVSHSESAGPDRRTPGRRPG
jgi:hypothetical protein